MKDERTLPALLAAQDWPAAERLLRRLAKGKAPTADVFYNLAKVLEMAGKRAQVRHWLERAVGCKPDYAIAWFELGRAAVDEGDLPAARLAFVKALALAPQDADARRSLGRVALRLGDWEMANACFAGQTDREAQMARYRIGAETGAPVDDLRAALLARGEWRPEVLKTLTRTAKGSIPLVLRDP